MITTAFLHSILPVVVGRASGSWRGNALRRRVRARSEALFVTFALGFLAGPGAANEPSSQAVRQALGQIETGACREARCAADRVRGKRNEVSRYQILPALWKSYGGGADFTNPQTAWSVTQRILAERRDHFSHSTGHRPNGFDLYVLWNAPGHYEQVGFRQDRVHPVIAERATRFARLVEQYAPTEHRGG